MKIKYLIVPLLTFFVMSANAQSRWGLRTGLNFDMAGIGLNEALSTTQSIFEVLQLMMAIIWDFSAVSLLEINFTSGPVHYMLRTLSFSQVRTVLL